MRRIVEVTSGDGLDKLLGKYVQLWCVNYIYAGKLVGVNQDDCVLSDPHIVYETGKMTDGGFKLAESCGVEELFIRLSAVESYSLAPQMVAGE